MANTGLVKTYYDDNQQKLKEEYFEVDGVKEGNYKSYHENGQLWLICNYANGLRHGEHKYFYITGELIVNRQYMNGKSHCQKY